MLSVFFLLERLLIYNNNEREQNEHPNVFIHLLIFLKWYSLVIIFFLHTVFVTIWAISTIAIDCTWAQFFSFAFHMTLFRLFVHKNKKMRFKSIYSQEITTYNQPEFIYASHYFRVSVSSCFKWFLFENWFEWKSIKFKWMIKWRSRHSN